MRQIRTLVQGTIERAFSEIVKGSAEKIDIIVTFLAILELTKQKFVDVRQNGVFQDIMVKQIV